MTESCTIHLDEDASRSGICVERLTNSVFHSNSYIVHDETDAIIVDIGDYAPLKVYIESHFLSVKALLITHTHYDHIYGIREFMGDYRHIPVYTSAFGKEAFRQPNRNFSRYHNDVIEINSDNIRILEDGDSLIPFKGCRIKVIATPGHDESCLSFNIGDCLFTGDSYIPGAQVIASFPKSDKVKAAQWYDCLEKMANNHTICPGHGIIHRNILHNIPDN